MRYVLVNTSKKDRHGIYNKWGNELSLFSDVTISQTTDKPLCLLTAAMYMELSLATKYIGHFIIYMVEYVLVAALQVQVSHSGVLSFPMSYNCDDIKKIKCLSNQVNCCHYLPVYACPAQLLKGSQ